uniref:Uncharacterized protein n=1 Tax=Pipistrellus kuhlii TaxID=59472 RepID=A0A7J7VV06_PIPKU|nr:hypothetical protein mPipKuh1_008245 [Pipistrellus kuhlii]
MPSTFLMFFSVRFGFQRHRSCFLGARRLVCFCCGNCPGWKWPSPVKGAEGLLWLSHCSHLHRSAWNVFTFHFIFEFKGSHEAEIITQFVANKDQLAKYEKNLGCRWMNIKRKRGLKGNEKSQYSWNYSHFPIEFIFSFVIKECIKLH